MLVIFSPLCYYFYGMPEIARIQGVRGKEGRKEYYVRGAHKMGAEMREEMTMSVSAIVEKDGRREIYVLFTESRRSAEGRLSDYRIIRSVGFTEEEAAGLEVYMRREKDTILRLAKNINVLDAFLKG